MVASDLCMCVCILNLWGERERDGVEKSQILPHSPLQQQQQQQKKKNKMMRRRRTGGQERYPSRILSVCVCLCVSVWVVEVQGGWGGWEVEGRENTVGQRLLVLSFGFFSCVVYNICFMCRIQSIVVKRNTVV